MPRPPRPWFRFYSEAIESRKVQKLKPPLFKHWINLMCLANIGKPRGTLPPIADISFRLRLTEDQITAILEELTALSLLDADGDEFTMHDWDEWQYESDANLTPGRATRNEVARSLERGKNAERTRKEHDSRSRRVADTDTDTDTEEEAEAEQTQSANAQGVVPVVRAFERCFGRPLSPMEIENIKHLEDEHPRERIDYALREAAELNKRNVRYIQRICENQESNGDKHERPTQGTGNTGRMGDPRELTSAEYAQLDRLGVFERQPINLDI